jgi:hypothetical protein
MTTKMADNPQTDAAKKQYEEEKKASDKSKLEYARVTKGKPTPTQEENDMAMLGANILEHEPDGSDPDPNVQETKHVEADKKPASYQTRHQTSTRAE